jgi:hypothetical protein
VKVCGCETNVEDTDQTVTTNWIVDEAEIIQNEIIKKGSEPEYRELRNNGRERRVSCEKLIDSERSGCKAKLKLFKGSVHISGWQWRIKDFVVRRLKNWGKKFGRENRQNADAGRTISDIRA